ncbi:MAG: amino acid transport protein [Candidatus Riflebacteria bacterium]|nr:amino acid transport protein [Candidatus Riflebacteria bacterium]
MLSLFWGSIGTGYFIYGKKQARVLFLVCGIGLCLFPMFISSNLWSLILGLGMTIAPFKLDV